MKSSQEVDYVWGSPLAFVSGQHLRVFNIFILTGHVKSNEQSFVQSILNSNRPSLLYILELLVMDALSFHCMVVVRFRRIYVIRLAGYEQDLLF